MISIKKAAFSSGFVLATIKIENLTNCKDKGPVECSFFLKQENFTSMVGNNKLGADEGVLLKPNANTADSELTALTSELVKKVYVRATVETAVTAYRDALLKNYTDAKFEKTYFKEKIKLSEELCKVTEKTDIAVALPFVEKMYSLVKAKCSGIDACFIKLPVADQTTIQAYVAHYDIAIEGGVDCAKTCPSGDATKTEIKVCSTGLSVGAIVGIVLGSLVGVAVIVGLIVFLLKKE